MRVHYAGKVFLQVKKLVQKATGLPGTACSLDDGHA